MHQQLVPHERCWHVRVSSQAVSRKEFSVFHTCSLDRFTCWWENSALSYSKIVQKMVRLGKTGRINGSTKNDRVSPWISHSKHRDDTNICYEKMQFNLPVQVAKIQETELSLTPQRNLRGVPDKLYFFKNLTLCPTRKFKRPCQLEGREKRKHLSVCYIRRPWRIGNKAHFPDEKWPAKNKAVYVKEINRGSQRAWRKAAEDLQRCVRAT